MCKELIITSPAFEDGGWIPGEYTGYGTDISPEIRIQNIADHAKSIAVVMDDEDHPLAKMMGRAYNHWLIWNLPVCDSIPSNIKKAAVVEELFAVQGKGYGKNQYRGPKPPRFIKKAHYYTFHVYTLDCRLELSVNTRKKEFMDRIKDHVLQHGQIQGKYQNK